MRLGPGAGGDTPVAAQAERPWVPGHLIPEAALPAHAVPGLASPPSSVPLPLWDPRAGWACFPSEWGEGLGVTEPLWGEGLRRPHCSWSRARPSCKRAAASDLWPHSCPCSPGSWPCGPEVGQGLREHARPGGLSF